MAPEPQPLKDLLAKLGRSQTDLAHSIGVGPSYVNQLCSGRLYPSERMRRDISAELGIPDSELFRP
jgi:transcriptional regulator with XRE-family HTH domain